MYDARFQISKPRQAHDLVKFSSYLQQTPAAFLGSAEPPDRWQVSSIDQALSPDSDGVPTPVWSTKPRGAIHLLSASRAVGPIAVLLWPSMPACQPA